MAGQDQTQRRPYLALFRAGPDSLHPSVVSGWEEQNFHYAISWFGGEPPSEAFVAGAQFVDLAPQPSKTLGLEHTLSTHWEVISEYEFVWLPDDDLLMQPSDLSEFFEVCSTLQLDLAQPAVRQDSYVTHAITAAHEGFQVRFTNFVEVMAPAFSKRLLAQARPTLHGALTGWGLDHLWRHMAPAGNIAIVDMAPLAHTRGFQQGVGYKVMEGTGLTVDDDLARTLLRYNLIPEGHRRITYGGILNDGTLMTLGDRRPEVVQDLFVRLQQAVGTLSLDDRHTYLNEILAFIESRERPFIEDILREKLALLGH
jgi:Protein of unknown function (DUF707)